MELNCFQNEFYNLNIGDKLDEKDSFLVNPAKDNSNNIPWLRRTEYISAQRNVYGKGLKPSSSATKLSTPASTVDSFASAKMAYLDTLKHPRNPDLQV